MRKELVGWAWLSSAGYALAQNPFPDPTGDMDFEDDPDAEDPEAPPVFDFGGLDNFRELGDVGELLFILGLATALGALIGYQPKYGAKVANIDAVETPKTCILYSVVGAVIGTMVDKYGPLIGFVVFGIGGLFRFRTNLGTARKTIRVILAALIGLTSGLQLPHMATGSAIFAFILLYVLDRTATYRILVKSLPHEEIPGAAAAYRELLENAGCRVLSEKKNFLKNQVSFAFRVKQSIQPEDLQIRFDEEIPENHQGAVDWDVR